MINVDTTNRVTAKITELENGLVYNVWVRANYAHGLSEWSAPQTATPIPPPASAPRIIEVQSGDEELTLSWTAVDKAEKYEVFYSLTQTPPDSQITTLAPTAESGLVSVAADTDAVAGEDGASQGTIVKGLTNGASYYLWVRAANTAGRSAYSTPDTGTPRGATAPPAAPVIADVIGGDSKLTVKWQAVNWAKSYLVYYAEGSTPPAEPAGSEAVILSSGKSVSAVISPLENEREYTVWIAARNTQGDSPLSKSLSGTPKPKPALDYDNMSFVIGEAAEEFIFAEEGNSDRLTQKKETALANLFVDGMRWYMRQNEAEYGPVDFVFFPGRYTRGGPLPKGPVTVGKVLGIVNSSAPVGVSQSFTLLTLTSAEVVRLFDQAASVSHTGNGGHPTGAWGVVSEEVSYTIDYGPTVDHKTGVIAPGTLKIHGEQVSAASERTYRICTLKYLANGEDDGVYLAFLDAAAGGKSGKKEYTRPAWLGIAEYIYQQDIPLHPDNYLKPGSPRVTRINDIYVK
jgi:hypothetical protein